MAYEKLTDLFILENEQLANIYKILERNLATTVYALEKHFSIYLLFLLCYYLCVMNHLVVLSNIKVTSGRHVVLTDLETIFYNNFKINY